MVTLSARWPSLACWLVLLGGCASPPGARPAAPGREPGCSAQPAGGPALARPAGGAQPGGGEPGGPDRGAGQGGGARAAGAGQASEAAGAEDAGRAGVPWVPLPVAGPLSGELRSGLFNPLPGGQLAGYRADTGLDIAASQQPVFAIAAATIEYAEAGHTRWVGRGDSRYTVRLRLDAPIAWKGRQITHAYYGHLSSLEAEVPSGAAPPVHVVGGQRLGVSGRANGSPHLHLGLLLDGQVEQDSWDYILREDDIRAVLGAGGTGKRLPR